MSCYDWERGSVQLPTAAWAKFKADLRDAYNRAVQSDFALMERLHTRVKELIKGKRGVNLAQVFNIELSARSGSAYGGYTDHYAFKLIDQEKVERLMLKDGKLFLPKKKDFPLANTKTTAFSAGYDGSITLNDEKRTVNWEVSENNHAVEDARQSHMGNALFRLLDKVTWTRGSGGHIYGSDEYRDDAGKEYAGGGGSYIKDTFGPLGEKAFEGQFGLLRLSRRASSPRRTSR
jgi:hypothetical protein